MEIYSKNSIFFSEIHSYNFSFEVQLFDELVELVSRDKLPDKEALIGVVGRACPKIVGNRRNSKVLVSSLETT